MEWERSGQWPFSVYAPILRRLLPVNERPSSEENLPGFVDISQEEMRWEAMQAHAAGQFPEYLQRVQSVMANQQRIRLALQKIDPSTAKFIVRSFHFKLKFSVIFLSCNHVTPNRMRLNMDKAWIPWALHLTAPPPLLQHSERLAACRSRQRRRHSVSPYQLGRPHHRRLLASNFPLPSRLSSSNNQYFSSPSVFSQPSQLSSNNTRFSHLPNSPATQLSSSRHYKSSSRFSKFSKRRWISTPPCRRPTWSSSRQRNSHLVGFHDNHHQKNCADFGRRANLLRFASYLYTKCKMM